LLLSQDRRGQRTSSPRFVDIEQTLLDIAEGCVVDGDPADVEAELMAEQDEIEFTLGADWFDGRDAE
jgi:hypothetical protein